MELHRRPPEALDRVYVILVESPVDVPQLGGLPDVCCAMRSMGVLNTFYFDPFKHGTGCALADFIRDIRENDPDSRIMLVGWSMGCASVKNALEHLEYDGQSVETVVYLDSSTLKFLPPEDHPQNYERAVMIYRKDHTAPDGYPRSEEVVVNHWFHLAIPRHPTTMNQLVLEAIRLADSAAEFAAPCAVNAP
jgi:pimeloyl-ACP methyl ester carboxylesterase